MNEQVPFSRILAGLLTVLLAGLLTGCVSYLQPVKSPVERVAIRVEYSFTLGRSTWPGPYTWPAEIYKPLSEDDQNIYFHAPSRVQDRHFKRLGGLLVKKSNGQVKAWYEYFDVFWNASDVQEINLHSGVSYTFVNIDDNTPIDSKDLPSVLAPK